ncbi:MAG: zinc ribbon domain-containing protein [bacterium]
MTDACISCGFPVSEAIKHGAWTEGRDFCNYCANDDGSLRTYDEVQARYSQFLQQSESLDAAAATAKVAGILAKQPAWQGRV